MAASVRVYIARWCESGFKGPAPYLPGCDGLGPAQASVLLTVEREAGKRHVFFDEQNHTAFTVSE